MNKTYYGIIQLIKSAVTQQPVQLPEEFDWEYAIKTAHMHKIEALIYYGIYYSGIVIPTEGPDKLTKSVHMMTVVDAQQQYEISLLTDAFLKEGISFMPLKGVLLKECYPKSEMRYMGDADILIREDEYPQIREIMTELGYSFNLESNHEYIWSKGVMQIELHKRLIPSYNEDYYAYYETGWRLAKLNDKTRYFMTDEDFLIYMVTHLAKHYRDSGIGIKHFVDVWVYKNQKNSLDEKYIECELKKLQLFDFYKNCILLLEVWFEGKSGNEITDIMTQWIFSSGAYGTEKNNSISSALKEEKKSGKNARLKFYIESTFPSYKHMCKKYKWLPKAPILLPFAWLVRMAVALLFKKGNVKGTMQKGADMTKQNIDEYQKALNIVGLDFDFKESNE